MRALSGVFFNSVVCLIFVTALFSVCNLYAESRHYDPSEVLVTPIGSGTIWYVDVTNGSDSNDGKTTGTAFKTLRKAVDRYGKLSAGDTVLLKAGIYREPRITISQDGTATNRITFGPLGDGEVIIDRSVEITAWAHYNGAIYKVPCNVNVRAVVVDDDPYFPEWNNPQEIDSGGKWYYDAAGGFLYLRVKGDYDPETRDIIVIKDDAYDDGIFLNDANYVTLYGLTVRGAAGHGISILGDYNRVEKCKIQFNAKAGVNLYPYSTIATTDTLIVKNYVYHNALRNWPRGRGGFKWGGWPMGLVSNGTPRTQFVGNISHKNGGEGMGAYGGPGGTIFEDNISYDNWSVNIYLDNQPNGIIRRNILYSHEPILGDLYNNLDETPTDGRNIRRLRPEGIMTADENYNYTPPANFRNAKIYNNLIVNCRRGITHYGQALGSGLIDSLFANNTIIVPNSQGTGEDYIGISIPDNRGNNSNTHYVNNIIYAPHVNTHLLYAVPTISTGIIMQNNLWYSSGNLAPFYWASKHLSYSTWKTESQQGASSKHVEPGLVAISADYDTGNYHLQQGSLAIDSGQDLSTVFSDDFDTYIRTTGKLWDIGADEYNNEPLPVPLIKSITIQ